MAVCHISHTIRHSHNYSLLKSGLVLNMPQKNKSGLEASSHGKGGGGDGASIIIDENSMLVIL